MLFCLLFGFIYQETQSSVGVAPPGATKSDQGPISNSTLCVEPMSDTPTLTDAGPRIREIC